MKRGILVLVLLFSFSSVSAITFTGYINEDMGNPVTISSASIANTCEGLTSSQCYLRGQQYGLYSQCFSCDTLGSNYQNYDGTGDTGRHCFWDYASNACYNAIVYGNALPVSGGINPGCNGNLRCFYGTPTDPDCNWVRGSWVSRSGYCAGGYIEYPSFRQDCDGVEDQYGRAFFTSGGVNYQLPTVTSYSNEGMCFDTCKETGSTVTDYELCSNGMTYTGTLSSASDSCPKTTHSDGCFNSVTYRNYSCDGSPSYSPGDMGYQYLSPNGLLDGTDAIYTDVDCSAMYPGQGPVCVSNCGSLMPGAGMDVCKSNQSVGGCSSNSCREGTRLDLDSGQNVLNDFINLCGASYTGDVQWAQGGSLNSYHFLLGSIGDYGEYSNRITWMQFVILIPGNPAQIIDTILDRNNGFDWGACGDDEEEYNIGGLCCDNPTDYVSFIPDGNLSDPLNMAGDYCVNQNGCGDGITNSASGEECDARYTEHVVMLQDGTIVSNDTSLVLGDDSGCAINEMCNEQCKCVLPENYGNVTAVSCGDNVLNVAGEECDNLNLDNRTCLSFGFVSGNLSCYPTGSANECTFDTSGCISAPAGLTGPDEYLIYQDCQDDGDGDEYGITITSLYSNDGNFLSNQSTICALDVEEIPFIGMGALFIFALIIFFFYKNEF